MLFDLHSILTGEAKRNSLRAKEVGDLCIPLIVRGSHLVEHFVDYIGGVDVVEERLRISKGFGAVNRG
jgi:hypothetical protein